MATMNVELTQEEITEAIVEYVERKFNMQRKQVPNGTDVVTITVTPLYSGPDGTPRYSGPDDKLVDNTITAKVMVEPKREKRFSQQMLDRS